LSTILTRSLLALALFLGLSPAASAQNRVWHFVKTHKAALVSDGLVAAAWYADAGATIYCQRSSTGCREQNPLLGQRPSAGAVLRYATGAAAGEILALHVIDKIAPDPLAKKVIRWFPTAAICGLELFNVQSNVDAAEFLQHQAAARARLAR
jgi:hypothetical protein